MESDQWPTYRASRLMAEELAYDRFGSLFFSPTPSQIPLLISSLVERGRPALISLGNCKDEDAQELRRCAQADHRGLIRLEEWVNQEAVLAHPVSLTAYPEASKLTKPGCRMVHDARGPRSCH